MNFRGHKIRIEDAWTNKEWDRFILRVLDHMETFTVTPMERRIMKRILKDVERETWPNGKTNAIKEFGNILVEKRF